MKPYIEDEYNPKNQFHENPTNQFLAIYPCCVIRPEHRLRLNRIPVAPRYNETLHRAGQFLKPIPQKHDKNSS